MSRKSSNTLRDESNMNNPATDSKTETDFLEDIEQIPAKATEFSVSHLSADHQQYLIDRHGTTELEPVPGFGNADPYNWSSVKKITNLILVAFHASMSTITAGSIIPAYSTIASDLNVSLQQATYLTSLQIAILGVAPLIWKPLSSRYGRRPVFLISLLCSLVGNIGCAVSPSYTSMAVCRAIVAFFISPAGAIGSVVVVESFFKKDRAKYMGVWSLLVTIGVPIGPFIFGFVTTYLGYRWIYWILTMINGIQLILYAIFGPETRYIRKSYSQESSDFKQEYVSLTRRIDPTPLTVSEFFRPLTLARYPYILLPTIAYAMNFLFGSILITVELPELFQEKFDLSAEQIGLQFLAVIIGSVIGEQLGGRLSNWWMRRRSHTSHLSTKSTDEAPSEFRLWLSHSGFLLTIIGTIVFLVQTQQATQGNWNITPLIGIAISGCGNQIVTTVLITYSVDCLSSDAGSVGVFITFVRQIWAFIGPFWFPGLFAGVGVANSAAVATALIVGVSVFAVVLVQWRGSLWRRRNANTEGEVRHIGS